MSTEIEQRVVEMRFDNKHFEKNVGQTMSTLEKLKAKLNLSGASKGLENLNRASNNVNMSGLAKGVETVRAKFSAMEVMGVTALANITNSAVNAGKRIAKALTIEPVMTGFKEYETQINAVQTILANTQKEGTNIDDVNEALDELNRYADQTIYNFTEMTRNIGTFTAAGVKLDDSVKAIKGIANLAAVSGSTSQQASTAMYQLSQALASGTVKLMDWNSVVNAGMGGQVFQDALKETARVHGIAIDQMIEDQGSFRETLSLGWLSSDILTETLEKFTYYAEEGTEEWNNYINALKQKGYTEAQAIEILKLGNSATDAATKVKTFTQLWDVLKEAVQSGWSQTWRLIIGDFEEAKALFTPIADFLTGIINKISNARNKLLGDALSFGFNPFSELMDKLDNSGIGKAVKKVNGITRSLEEYQKVVRNVWRGNYNNRGDNPDRFDLLRKEGWNASVVQTLVNKGAKYKLTIEDIEKAEKKYGLTTVETTKAVEELTDEQLRNAGLTSEEIEMYRELEKASKETGVSIEELAASMEEANGRTLLLESFQNIGSSIVKIFKAIGDAWRNAFPPMTSMQLYNIIAGLNEFSTHLKMSDRTAENLTRTLKGVFAIVDLISMVIGGGLKIAFTILKTVLGMFNLDILQFTAILGDAIVAFRDWVESHNPLVIVIKKVVPLIIKMGKAIGKFAKQLWELPGVQKVVTKIVNAFKKLSDIKLKDVTSALKSFGKAIKRVLSAINDHFGGVPGDILSGLANGIKNGASKVLNSIITLAKKIISKFKEVLGIHSPSKVFFAIGGFIIAGLIGGLLSSSGDVGNTVRTIAGKVAEFFQDTDWGQVFSKVFTGGMSIGLLMVAKNLSDTLKNFSSLAGGLGSMFDGIGEMTSAFAENAKRISKSLAYTVKSFGKVLRGIAFKKTAEGIKELAWSLLIIAGAIALLTLVDPERMTAAVFALSLLAGVMVMLSMALAKVSSASVTLEKGKGLQLQGTKTVLLNMALALLAMATTIKMIGKLEPDQYKQGVRGLVDVVVLLGALIAAYGYIVKGDAAQNMDKAAKMFSKIGKALLMMVIVVKLASLLDQHEINKGIKFIAGFTVFIGALVFVTKSAGDNIDKVGKLISKVSWSLILMVAVVKLVSLLKENEMTKAAAFASGFVVFIGALVAVTKIGNDKQIAKIGGTLLAVSFAMLVMVGVVKTMSYIDEQSLKKGLKGVLLFGAVIAGLIAMVKLVGPEAPKLAGTIMAMGVAIGILAAVALVLSLVDTQGLAKGIVAVGLLGSVMALMIRASKGVGDIKGNLIAMTVAIGLMAAAITILSFIKPEKLVAPTIAMMALMGMFALIESQAKYATGSWQNLAIITGAIVAMAGVLYVLSKLPVERTIGSATALSTLMVTMAGVLFIISKTGTIGKDAIIGIGALVALCVPLLALVGILKLMSGIDNVIQNAMALSGFMTVLTIVLLGTAAVGAIYSATAGLAATGLLGIVGVIATLYLLMGVLAIMSNISNAITNLESLTSFLKTLTGILVILAIIGPFALTGVTALGALTGLMGVIGVFAVAVGALMEKFPAIQNFLNIGLPVLIQLAGGIGQMIGAFVSGIITQLAGTLPVIGIMLSQFMMNVIPFIEGAKLIDSNVLVGVGILTAAILALTVADLVEGITSFLTGGESFATLGTELSNFMTNAKPFVEIANTIKPGVLEGVKSLAEAILIITNAKLIDGLSRLFGGESAVDTFGTQLVSLGNGLNGFIKSVGPLSDEQITTAKNAAEIIKALASAAKEIPNTGGLLGSLVGENDMGPWSTQLPLVATGIVDFTRILSENKISEDSIKVAETAAKVITSLAQASSEIPNTGGLLAQLVGDNDLATFASGLPLVGKGIVGFIQAMTNANITEDQANVANTAAKIIKTLAGVSKDIPNTGGMLAALIGDNDLKTFASGLPDVGKGIAGFCSKLSGLNDAKVKSVNAATAMLKAIVNLGKLDLGKYQKSLNDFSSNLTTFGTNMSTFISSLNNIGAINILNAKNHMINLLDIVSKVSDVDLTQLKTFSTTLKTLGTESINSFVNAFKGDGPKTNLINAVKNLCTAVTDTLSSKTFTTNVKSAGAAVSIGFAAGIRENKATVSLAGTEIGNYALTAAKAAIDSNSPSKEAMKIGNYFGQGLVIGINQYKSKTYDTAYSIGDEAKDGLTRAVSRISSAIDSNIDTQPTIRPVLDLSDVESGAGYLNTMFNNSPSIGVMSNLRAISSSMETKRQNGINSDVVTAIDDLRKDLGNIGGTTNNYNVNGVSYADTDNDINNAVKTLVRAAVVERRI